MRGANMVWVVVAVAIGAATMTWGWRLLHPRKGVKAEGFVRRFFGLTLFVRQFLGVTLIVIGIIIVILALWVVLILFGDESSFFPY